MLIDDVHQMIDIDNVDNVDKVELSSKYINIVFIKLVGVIMFDTIVHQNHQTSCINGSHAAHVSLGVFFHLQAAKLPAVKVRTKSSRHRHGFTNHCSKPQGPA